jgi:alpha-N-arabinofuranosidase
MSIDMGNFIKSVIAICDFMKAKKRSKKTLYLSFDEWNVWYHSNQQDKKLKEAAPWTVALPLLEDVYNFEDALLVGLLLMTLLKNSDRVKIACFAQLVNVIAPIMTENGGESWRQTTFFPIAYTAKYGQGTVLRAEIESDTYGCDAFADVPYVDAVCVLREEVNEAVVFAVNRSEDTAIDFSMELQGLSPNGVIECKSLHGYGLKAVNSKGDVSVVPKEGSKVVIQGDEAVAELKPLSWNMFRLSLGG